MFIEAIRAYLVSSGVDATMWTRQQIMEYVDQTMMQFDDPEEFDSIITNFWTGVRANLLTVKHILHLH